MARAAVAASVREALAAAVDALAAAGVASPRLDAELLLAAAMESDRAALVADAERGVEAAVARRFGEMVRRRVAREPVAYVLGRKGFRHLELGVDRRALIPRPETELLVEIAVESPGRRMLDVGTGSGAVALAIADERRDAELVACDTSEAALSLARENAARLGLEGRVRFVRAPFPAGERFDLVVANLPYVAEREWEGLAPEITRYEPREALVPGPTGLEAIIGLVRALEGGAVAADAVTLEVGVGQAAEVTGLLRAAGMRTATRRDLAGIERVVVGRRDERDRPPE